MHAVAFHLAKPCVRCREVEEVFVLFPRALENLDRLRERGVALLDAARHDGAQTRQAHPDGALFGFAVLAKHGERLFDDLVHLFGLVAVDVDADELAVGLDHVVAALLAVRVAVELDERADVWLALRILHLADVEAAHHVVVIRQESVLVALVEFALIGLHLRLDVLEDAKDASSVRRIKPKVVFCVRRQRLPAEHRIIFVGQV